LIGNGLPSGEGTSARIAEAAATSPPSTSARANTAAACNRSPSRPAVANGPYRQPLWVALQPRPAAQRPYRSPGARSCRAGDQDRGPLQVPRDSTFASEQGARPNGANTNGQHGSQALTRHPTIWRFTLKAAGCPGLSYIYDLRSTYATRLSAGGVADERVRQNQRGLWWAVAGSNRGPPACKAGALTG
jgi:hypothetical protein